MPVTIQNQAVAFEFTDAATIGPSNFENITYAIFNNTCEIEVWNTPQGDFHLGDWGGILLQAPGQTTLARCGGVRFRCNRSNGLPITAVTQSPGAVTVAGDATTAFQAGFHAVIHGSTGNDGSYVVASAAVSGSNTVITFTTNLPSATANGSLFSCAQIIAYAWKDDEVQIASSTAASGNLAGSGFSPFDSTIPVGFASYSGSLLAVPNGSTKPFVWVWDALPGQEDMFDLTARPALGAEPVARQSGIYHLSFTAEFSHAAVADGVFELGFDLNSSLGMPVFAAGSFPTERAVALPFGNIGGAGPMAAGDYWDNSIENGGGTAVDFFGFAYFVRYPLRV